jgi:hypothetical protein
MSAATCLTQVARTILPCLFGRATRGVAARLLAQQLDELSERLAAIEKEQPNLNGCAVAYNDLADAINR